jgi:thymidylate synthase ThyX
MENQVPETGGTPAEPPNSTEVYAVHGAEPEVQAYAMAKYSRSALSMKESLREISTQKAEKFLNTFYFQYGHRSIADLAHIALAVERLSILAAIAVVDEQRWDGQERSTRYQDFRKSGYYVPDFGNSRDTERLYRGTMDSLFADYDALSDRMWRYLAAQTPRPAEMKQDAYERTLKARAFDLTRYLLPLGTNTSLGEIVNARTLESQVSHLLSHTHAEVRRLAALMKRAATEPAYNVSHETWRSLLERVHQRDAALAAELSAELLKPVRVAPTLVKYADPNAYEMETRRELQQAAAETMRGAPIEHAAAVQLLEDDPFEVELATTLLYEHCHYSYRQIRNEIEGAGASWRRQVIEAGARHRGKHDELLRAFAAGQRFRFDIVMDIGGFRDLHRHRRCVQIGQGFTTAHGYDTPEEFEAAGEAGTYATAMHRAAESVRTIAAAEGAEAEQNAQYAIPLGYRKRTLFKMDFAEVVYIAELRTTPAGHVSYRRVAWEMFREVASRYPALAGYFRVHDVHEAVDLLKR